METRAEIFCAISGFSVDPYPEQAMLLVGRLLEEQLAPGGREALSAMGPIRPPIARNANSEPLTIARSFGQSLQDQQSHQRDSAVFVPSHVHQ